ncbi:hypothetical protein ITX44_00840 [Streptomyces sp. KK5PA1]|uniref:DUF6286 domain-containing protein n=1 Tax=Actinacidiphila acididurans TaxID=2784346 RepID=A0ABS2TID6_9ACTN|nr:hypothetical protein [Actinacidiphila acididurans]
MTALACGALLFEAVWTRAGNRANTWWTTLSNELATRPVDDVWILTGAAVAAALGLVLLILALTRGNRGKLPMKVPAGGPAGMRAVVDRRSAALILRDATMSVPGTSAARVRVGRHRIHVRAEVRFRDPADVKAELTKTVGDAASGQLRLAHPPKQTIHVRRSPT